MIKNTFVIITLFLCSYLHAQSDYSDKNVTIELLVVEYEHGDEFDWGFDVTAGTTGRLDGINYSPGTNNTLDFNYNFLGQLDPNFKFNLKALIANNYAQVVTNPHISVKNNQAASLEAKEVQYIVLQTANVNGVSNSLTTIDAGIQLDATPTIVNDSIVTLNINGSFSEFIPTGIDGERIIEANKIVTNVIVKDGYSLIIGGLIKEEEFIIKSKVPFLGSIPLLGLLFRREVKTKAHKEIVIYITPHIHGAGDKPKMKLEKIGNDLLKKNRKNYKTNKKTKKLLKLQTK